MTSEPTTTQQPPLEQDDAWLRESPTLAPRPRRRLLAPVPLALLAVLLITCGFIGGVLVEKGQSASNATADGATGLASRLAALRGGASATGTRSSAAAAGGLAGAGSTGGLPVAGQVAYVAGSTLYVTDAEGNTVKVKTSHSTGVTRNVTASVKGIHPGETVTVVGPRAAGGSVSAETIRVGSAGGGLASLFSGAGGQGAGPASGASTGNSETGAPALFGKGG